MEDTNLEKAYLEWMYKLMCEGRYSEDRSYRKLFSALHDIEFKYIIPNDINRAKDGKKLRGRYADSIGDESAEYRIIGPCSVLEMMIGLAIRCEETIMDDPEYGNRTKQWFWIMIKNLELGGLYDEVFDIHYVESTIARLLNRDYEPDGHGGLFVVKNFEHDLREVEIWVQLLRYLDNFNY